MTNKICDGCETVAHCLKNECISKPDTLAMAVANDMRIEALKAQPQQRSDSEHVEPVAYAVYHRMGGGKSLHWPDQHSPDGDANEYQLVPLYKFPPAKRTWVGLTTNEVEEIFQKKLGYYPTIYAVEAKLKAKNSP